MLGMSRAFCAAMEGAGLEIQNGGDEIRVFGFADLEAEVIAQGAHGGVFGKNMGDDFAKAFVAGDVDQAGENFGSEAEMLAGIAHEDRNLAILSGAGFIEATDGDDFAPGSLRRGALGDESDFAVVVNEAFADEARVSDAGVQIFHVKVAEIDALVGKCLVEFDHERFVFRANGTNQNFLTIF